jgi:predicted RNase H-like HicB family nuclease
MHSEEEHSMKKLKYVVYQEGKYFVSQGLNIDVASCGDTMDEAISNLKEAVELYLKDDDVEQLYQSIENVALGETLINA